MSADTSRTFQLEPAQLERFAQEVPNIPWEICGSRWQAQIEVLRISLELAYDPLKQTLMVTIVSKPSFISEETVWHELEKYLAGEQEETHETE